MRKWLRISCKTTPIVLALALAGCGGGSSDSAPPEDAPPGTTTGSTTGDTTGGTTGTTTGDTTGGTTGTTTGDTTGGTTGGTTGSTTGSETGGGESTLDTDSDGQIDSHEETCGSDSNNTNSMSSDVDGDNIPDCVDLINEAQSTESDTDGDGQSDADESTCASDPNSALSTSADADDDGIPDCVELATGDPSDTDGDLQLNDDELACGSDPEDADSMSSDANADNRPDCLRGYPVLPVTGSAGDAVDCKATMPCTWINSDNTIRVRMTYADSRDSSTNENESVYYYGKLGIVYEVYSEVDTDLTFLDTASYSDSEFGVSEFSIQRFLNIANSYSYGSEVVSLLAGTSVRVLTTFDDGVKGQGSLDTLTLPFLQNELRFESVFNNVYFGRVNSLDKDCQNLLPCTWISPDGATEVAITSLGLTSLADLKAELSVLTRRDGVTLTLDTESRGVGSDLSTFTGTTQRFDQVNDLSRSLVNATMENGVVKTATVVFNESPNSALDRLARMSLDLFETIPQSPNYEENSSSWNRYRVIHTPRLDPVFRNIPLTQ